MQVFRQWVDFFVLNWSNALKQKNFGYLFGVNFIICFALCLTFSHYLIENRYCPGVILSDPLFEYFQPRDFSVTVFVLMYLAILLFLYYILPRPSDFIGASRAYTVLLFLRIVFITLVPLAPPAEMIPLHDVFIDRVVGFQGEVENDLFFSGHVATLALFVFCCRVRPIRAFMIVATVLVSIMLIWQKVHYSADVIAAPFFAYVCYVVFVKEQVLPVNDDKLKATWQT